MDEVMAHSDTKQSLQAMRDVNGFNEYCRSRIPHRLIADFLNVGATAISEMSRKGRGTVDESNLD